MTTGAETGPLELVSLLDMHAVLVRDHGWPAMHPPRRQGDPPVPIMAEQQEKYVRLRAEALGLHVRDGWAGKPALAVADADALLAAQSQAEAEQRERENRDAAASDEAEAERDPAALRVSELVEFFGAKALSNAARPGGFGIPGPVRDPDAFQQQHAPALVAMQTASFGGSVAPPTPPADDGW
jgi:hypothetical protein